MDKILILIIEILAFGLVVLVSLAITRLVSDASSVRRRIALTSGPDEPRHSGVLKKNTITNPLLSWIQSFTSISDPVDRGKLQKTLSLAGFDGVSVPAT